MHLLPLRTPVFIQVNTSLLPLLDRGPLRILQKSPMIESNRVDMGVSSP